VDSICQSVYTKLFFKCREELIDVIEQELQIYDENGKLNSMISSTCQSRLIYLTAVERCMELMAEDPERQRRRQYLLREKEKISKAQGWLSTAKKEEEPMVDTETTFQTRIKTEDWSGLSNLPAATGQL